VLKFKKQIVISLWVAFFVCFHFVPLAAARGQPGYEADPSIAMREILDQLSHLRHKVNNHEAEIRIFEERFKNQEEILDSLRSEMLTTLQGVKDNLKNHSLSLESKLFKYEDASKGFSSDFRSYAKEHEKALTAYKDRILDLEKTVEIQNRNIESLQAALSALMDAFQVKGSPSDKGAINDIDKAKIYQVKAGDTLEKIAKEYKTTPEKLKKLNGLDSDKIIIRQKLKVAE
jgi:LysM repeat protein